MRGQMRSEVLIVPLSLTAHGKAREISRLSPNRGRHIYLSSLACSAVEHYLRCLGYDLTDSQGHSQGQRYNLLHQPFFDGAVLWIKGLGRLECLPVLPGETVCVVPPESKGDRLAYLPVLLEESLKSGTLLGFTTKATDVILLKKLQSLTELPFFLHQERLVRPQVQTVYPVNASISRSSNEPRNAPHSEGQRSGLCTRLGRWFGGQWEEGWQTVDGLLTQPQWALLRQAPTEGAVRRAKLLDLDLQIGAKTVVLAMAVIQNTDATLGVRAQLFPRSGDRYLPANLQLTMFSETGEVLQQICSRDCDNFIQLRRFSGHPEDRFSIEIALGSVKVCEEFVV